MLDQNDAKRVTQKVSDTLVVGITASAFVLAILFGTIGTYLHLSTQPAAVELSTPSLLIESLLTAVGFLVLNPGPFPVESRVALVLLFLARLSGAVFVASTVLVTAFHVFTQQIKPLEIELKHRLTARFTDGAAARHTLVCGLTDQSTALAVQLRAEGERVVVIEEDAASSAVRRVRQSGAWVLEGSLSDIKTLVDRGKVRFANEAFVTIENEQAAVTTIQALYEAVDNRGHRSAEGDESPLQCYVNLSPSGTRRYLHEQVGTGSKFATRLGGRDTVELYTYDEPTATARELLRQHPPDPPASHEGDSIHILLVGWSPRIQAIIVQLCHLLHVGDRYDRRITVATADPEARWQALREEFPCLEPANFPDDGRREFIESVMPTLEFIPLPERPERLVADESELTGWFESDQYLTVIVDEEDPLQTGYLVSRLAPRIDEYGTMLDMHTQLLYYEAAESDLDVIDGIDTETLETMSLTSFSEFYDEITPSAVRGKRRDELAKRVAFYYFLEYDYGSDDAPERLTAAVSERLGKGLGPADDAASLLTALTQTDISELAGRHWNRLSEHYRDANRFAADHLPFKRRLATRLQYDSDSGDMLKRSNDALSDREFAAQIATVEHQRWCAEKLLSGWEPLSKEQWNEWETDTMQQKLRARRYHRDIWPIEELNVYEPTVLEKDIEQVRFLLKMLDQEVLES